MPLSEAALVEARVRRWRRLPHLGGSVRARLLRLALMLLIPGLAISALLIWRTYETDRAEADAALRDTARTLGQLVDREFLQAEVLLRTLAATDELAGGDLPAFERLARATSIMQGHIVLLDRTGHILLDTSLPALAAPPSSIPPWATTGASAGQLVVGPLQQDAGGGAALVPVILPIVTAGVHEADLALIVPAKSFQTLLDEQRLPGGWIVSIWDAGLTLVARSQDAARFIGHRADRVMRQRVMDRPDTIATARSLEEVPIVVATSRSASSHWVVGVASPVVMVAQSALRAFEVLVGLGSGAVAIGLLGALHVARRIARPIEATAAAARRLGRGELLSPIPRGLDEADEVAIALQNAASAMQERRAALSELNRTLAERVEARTRELAEANAAMEAQQGRLRAILDQMPIGVLVRGLDDRIFYANPAAVALLGSSGPDVPAVPALQRAVGGQRIERELLALERPDGHRVDAEISAGPVLDEHGEVVLSVTTLQDVTSRLEAEEARRRSQRLEAVGQLTGGVAHEFNNLLMAVSGALELLAPDVTAARGQRMLTHARRATERGARLTGQLLAFARKQHLQVEPTDVNALVAGMTELLASTLGRSVSVETQLDPAVWPAMADAAQLELVLLNLAINARDAMQGGGRITITTSSETVTISPLGRRRRLEDPPPGIYTVLCLADTGSGMAPAVLARAFEPFFTTKEVGRGSGLGLAQVLGVAQQLGGGVRIDSTLEHGTRVSVFLPRAAAAAVTRPPAPVDRSPVLHNAHVLVVDDDAGVRDVARGMLEESGVVVSEADSGAAALLLLRTGPSVDLVLADLTMPAMTGLELADEIGAWQPGLPVILMSGYSADGLGADPQRVRAVLQKPFRAADLAVTVAAALGREMVDM